MLFWSALGFTYSDGTQLSILLLSKYFRIIICKSHFRRAQGCLGILSTNRQFYCVSLANFPLPVTTLWQPLTNLYPTCNPFYAMCSTFSWRLFQMKPPTKRDGDNLNTDDLQSAPHFWHPRQPMVGNLSPIGCLGRNLSPDQTHVCQISHPFLPPGILSEVVSPSACVTQNKLRFIQHRVNWAFEWVGTSAFSPVPFHIWT